MYDILFSGVTAVTFLPDKPVIKDAYVGISGSVIAYVGETPPECGAVSVVKGARLVLMPGLYNSHTHIAMTQLRGYADDYDLHTWLYEQIFPAEEKMTDESVYWGAQLGIIEAIASGTVSITDMYDHMDFVARAAAETGIMANLTRALLCFDEKYDINSDRRAAEMRGLVEDWHGHDDSRIKIDVSIHGEYTSKNVLWKQVAAYASSKGLGMNVHVSETLREHEECKARSGGLTPAQVLNGAGVFEVRTTAAHCVWAEDCDIEIFADKHVIPVHNPVSNLKLASGVARVPRMLERGVTVALGTDGVASNNSHDMFEEIKLCAILHKKETGDPTAVCAYDALKMAVTGGVTAQGRENCGVIREGAYADLILLDFDKPHLAPCFNVISNIVYAARGSDVKMTMVRGKTLYKDGVFLTVDKEKVMKQASFL